MFLRPGCLRLHYQQALSILRSSIQKLFPLAIHKTEINRAQKCGKTLKKKENKEKEKFVKKAKR